MPDPSFEDQVVFSTATTVVQLRTNLDLLNDFQQHGLRLEAAEKLMGAWNDEYFVIGKVAPDTLITEVAGDAIKFSRRYKMAVILVGDVTSEPVLIRAL